MTGRRGQLAHADMTADLTQATLTSSLIGIHKPSGVPATAHIGVDFAKGAAVKQADVRIFAVESVGAELRADARTGRSGRIGFAEAEHEKLGA
jgi:hypothetical protein